MSTQQYNYYDDEMKRTLPVDQYGVSIQIRTTKGHTKWLGLNHESFTALRKNYAKQIRKPKSEKLIGAQYTGM